MKKMDCFYGMVSSSNKSGIYIQTEEGNTVFSYYGKLKAGTRVLCTVIKEAKEGKYPRVSIDSVVDEYVKIA